MDIVEPASDLIIDDPNTALQILKLVTFVGNIETEAPIIVISRYVIESIIKRSVYLGNPRIYMFCHRRKGWSLCLEKNMSQKCRK